MRDTGVRSALDWGVAMLSGKVPSPEVDTEILLRHVTGTSRPALATDPDRLLEDEQLRSFRGLIERRARLEPLQYLTGRQGFRGLVLEVGPGVLVPRQETEQVVERALELIAEVADPLVADIGTGSGAIALSLGAERADATVWATEISPDAFRWAERNLRATGAGKVRLLEGDLFGPLPGHLRGGLDLVVCNPPYLSETELDRAPADVRDHEPRSATVSGPVGLEIPGRVVAGAVEWLRPGGWLVMETSPTAAGRLRSLMAAEYESVAVHLDLAGLPRIAEGRKRHPGAEPS